jgi:drug/metabolite transporter (DMT)-like permease
VLGDLAPVLFNQHAAEKEVAVLAFNQTVDQSVVSRSTRYFVFVGVLWSFFGILIQDLQWSLMAAVAVRGLAAVLTQTILLTYLKRKYGIKWNQAFCQALRGIGAFNRVHWSGAIIGCLNVVCLVISFKRASSTSAGFFQASGVLWIGVLSGWFLHEKPGKGDWIAMGIAVIGMPFLTADGFQWRGGQSWQGSAIGVLCSLTLAVSQICYKRRSNDAASGYGALEMSTLSDAMVVVVAAAVVLIFEGVPSAPSVPDCWRMLALCTVAWTLPSAIYIVCVKDLPVFRAFLLTLFDPVLTPVWPWLFHGRQPSTSEFIGATIVSSGILYQGVSLALAGRKAALAQPVGLVE